MGFTRWLIGFKRAVRALSPRFPGIPPDRQGNAQARIQSLEYEARAMQQREQEYLEILDGAADGSWIYDPQTGTVRYSEQWVRRIGADSVPPEQRMIHWETILHPEDREKARQARRHAFRTRQSKYDLEYRLKTADGEHIWVMDRCKVIYDGAGRPVKVYGTSLDITSRKRAEEALRRSEALLRAIINGTRDPVFLKDRDGRILMANDATAATLGLPLNGLSESGLPNETAGEWYGDMRGHDDWVMEHDTPVTVEEHVFSAGQERTFMTSKVPWYDEQGNVIGLIGIARDITERIRMERELRNTAQELAEKNALITDFFVNVSHEFRTPLSVLQMTVEILDEHARRGELDADWLRHSIDVMDSNTRRLTRLVGNMLDITRINAGAKQPSYAPVDIIALLRNLVELVQPYALRRGLEITLLAGRKTTRVLRTDAELVARIVVNLLSNAIKYTPRGGWVRVACGGGAAGCRISVKDNGEGIPDDKQQLIFDHFHKANNTLARSSEGCGIGLSLAKSLAELLGGSIRVKSTLGHGSAFFVDLPDRREVGAQHNAGLLSAHLQDLVITELSDISF